MFLKMFAARVTVVCSGKWIQYIMERVCMYNIYVLVCKGRVVKFLQLSHSAAPQVYEIVFDVTHTKLLNTLLGLQGGSSCALGAANADQRVSLVLHAVASSLVRRSIVLLLCKQLQGIACLPNWLGTLWCRFQDRFVVASVFKSGLIL